MATAIIAFQVYVILLLAYAGWDVYCSRKNRSEFFSANVNANVIQNVEERVAQNVKRNVAQRRIRA